MAAETQTQPAPDPNEILKISIWFYDCLGGNRDHRTSFSTYQEALSIIAGGPTELIDRKKAKENNRQNVYPCYYGNWNKPALFQTSEEVSSFMEYGHSKDGEFSKLRDVNNPIRIITDQNKVLQGVIFHYNKKEKDHRRAIKKRLDITYKQLLRKEDYPGRSPTRVELQTVHLFPAKNKMPNVLFQRIQGLVDLGEPPALENYLDTIGRNVPSPVQERVIVHECLKGLPNNVSW